MLIKAWQSGLTAAALFMLAVTVVALVAFAVAPVVREGWRKWRKRASAGVAVAASAFAIIYGGSKGVNAGADEGIVLAEVTANYDPTNDVTAVAVKWTEGTVSTSTPVSVRNAESEQWRELVKIGAAIETGATNVLSFTVAGDESAHGFWWVGFDTPAVIVETAGITITNFVATSKSVSIAWTCDATNQQYFTVQRKHPADAEWQVAGDVWTNTTFALSGFTVGETWMWRVIGRETIYDAEVEYIESTGTQWIEIGMTFDARCVLDMTFQFTRFVDAATCHGQTSTGSIPARFALGKGAASWNDWYCGIGDKNYRTGTALDLAVHRFVVDAPGDKFVIDGTTYNVGWTSFELPSAPNSAMLYNRARVNSASLDTSGIYGKLYRCQIWQDGVLVRDFIPVRFANERGLREGAMYDRVTGQLFRNAGTGSFRYGSDK